MARNGPAAAVAANDTAAAADLGEEQLKRNRPKDTKLTQQRLPAWQPIFNAKTVIPVFFSISVLFIPLGVVLMITSNSVKEWSIYYDVECEKRFPGQKECTLNITLPDDYPPDLYFYYGLENYYQNHRRYMRSRNDKQLLGQLDLVSDCAPFDCATPDNKSIAPCGAIANSMFNDTFQLSQKSGTLIRWTKEELIWPIDRTKFRNPQCGNRECIDQNELCGAFKDYAKPPNWQIEPCRLDNNVSNSGFQSADFIIWMRTAAFPDFRKPYGKLDVSNHPAGLPKGDYVLVIGNHYNVSSFSGRKSFIISTTSWLGGKNPFLGFAYIVVGVLCAIAGGIFIAIHLKYGHSLHEMAAIEQTRIAPMNRS